jgi:hypothetical protein
MSKAMQSGFLHNVRRNKSNGQGNGEHGEVAHLLSGKVSMNSQR